MSNETDPGWQEPEDASEWRWKIWGVAGAMVFVACAVSVYSIYRHLTNYRAPELQRRIVRILLMVPIYAIDSWLSLRFPDAAIYLNTLRNCYEAFVLYQFFMLLVSFLGGEHELERKLGSEHPIPHPWPFYHCLGKIEVSHPNFLLHVKRGILQFVVVKPLLAILAIILEASGVFEDGHWRTDRGYMYITILDNFSITLSMYCLVVFYQSTSRDLETFRAVSKFLCIKAVIFFTFWQAVVVSGLVKIEVIRDVGVYTAENVATGVQDFLICFEMMIAAFAHLYAFSHKEYQTALSSRVPLRHTLIDVFTFGDVVHDTRQAFDVRVYGERYTRVESGDEDIMFTDYQEDSTALMPRQGSVNSSRRYS
eukprot:Colp12_sorted_trinity150504_noHs@18201